MMRLRFAGVGLLLLMAAGCAGAPRGDAALQDVRFEPSAVWGTEGYFRVGQSTEGRWFFIDPEGKAFFYRGVTSVNPEGTYGGRRAKPGRYTEAVLAKYGEDPLAFRDAQLKRLRGWGFNALGAWCDDVFFDADTPLALPYTEIVEFGYVGPQIKGEGIWLPDVFDETWAAAIDAEAKRLCAPRKNSKMLIGYFTDNELSWAQWRGEDIEAQTDPSKKKDRPRPLLLQHCLSLPEDAAAYQAAWAFVLERHGSVEAAGRAWGVDLASREDVRKLTAIPAAVIVATPQKPAEAPPGSRWDNKKKKGPPPWRAITTPGFLKDQEAFSRLFAERYFRLSAEAIRRHDPNHLILGCRFGGPPGDAVLSAMRRPWVDVVSANNYRPNMRERMDVYYAGTGLPVLNGEFAYHSGLFRIHGKTPDRMAAMGAAALEELCTHPAVVGYTFYRWNAGDPAKMKPDEVTCGLVNNDDREDRLNGAVMREVNARAPEVARKQWHWITPVTGWPRE